MAVAMRATVQLEGVLRLRVRRPVIWATCRSCLHLAVPAKEAALTTFRLCRVYILRRRRH
jgi:hypothetical protein